MEMWSISQPLLSVAEDPYITFRCHVRKNHMRVRSFVIPGRKHAARTDSSVI